MNDERRFRREAHMYRQMLYIAIGMVGALSQVNLLRGVKLHFAVYSGWDWVGFAAVVASLVLIAQALVHLIARR